ncbi:MAG: cytochrome C peroxidase [bacterium]|nr:cytochrome C peroxidase [bacterium]
MIRSIARLSQLAWMVVFAVTLIGPPAAAENPCNPCAANPCASNPCNPCGANPCNPCGANPCNPCGGNPCNPCGGGGADASRFMQPKGVKVASADAALVAEGEALWNDKALSGSGAVACATCHVGGTTQMNASFADAYPHRVAMPHQAAGVDKVNAAEMVQFCMITPMANEPLSWSGRQLAALTAYVEKIQQGFEAPAGTSAANPCNPCGANPCSAGNPCNPCGN